MHIRFLVPGNVRHGSGGNKYNAKLAEHLTALGASVETVTVDGDWPVGSPADRQRFAQALDGGTTVIADGLVASGAPEEIAGAVKAGTKVWILSHMALAEHGDLESKALAAATGIICPSVHSAAELQAKHGSLDIAVATPGAEPADLSAGSQPKHIVAVAALLPNKDQAHLVEALSQIKDLPWTAALIGSEEADPAYAAEVRAAVEHHALQNRIRVTGELTGTSLEEQWHQADLSVLLSHSESFGMVVTESLAHGVPVLVRQGTGAVEALGGTGAGAAWDPREALADTLRSWLTDVEIQGSWHENAILARDNLSGWDNTAAIVLKAVTASP
ncbi:glycosyl transferase [Arthrobacter sp. StoSoilB3]|uniref:glycosyltransferase family 4 protein n=1 Tax=Paenarthrobacter nicotinovorans TaxID=29320 RepID=UPI0005832D47|nr:glycosyltransferase family 4 protein [Paenarthrobacter nicotinovorans]KIA74620.1 glycosyl transferase, group 1 family protein [Arthrobacter sp. MWB30]BCW39189.1 glycosyl transferase [Arthrobacter sp. StoSoilB3]MBP2393875.1 glycosyltransferase involved in cell wall biosynthesis [Paenarthrobacter nicotinovorans]UKE99887.1 glycosyltransferase family 4 protein [Paenarthrobacter nicotinovorans]UKF04671.1 glycosyltransferase family 4 protein [Paenarthrobacter nicotinovorans]